MSTASKVIEILISLPREKLKSLTYEDLLDAGIDVRKFPLNERVLIAKELHNLGLGYKRISNILNVNIGTVYRYINIYAPFVECKKEVGVSKRRRLRLKRKSQKPRPKEVKE
jgi:transposase